MTQSARSPLSVPDLFENDAPPAPARTVRIDNYVGPQIRMRDTPAGAEQFRRQVHQLQGTIGKVLHGATFERALRRFVYMHRGRILKAAVDQHWSHRVTIEADLVAMLQRAFLGDEPMPGAAPQEDPRPGDL